MKVNRLLIAVDDARTSKEVIFTFMNLVWKPVSVILLHVERLQGRSLMIDMLGEAELSTLKESLKGTEHKEALDEKAEKILACYKEELEKSGALSVTTVIRAGRPADEILKVADEKNADQILLGYKEQKGFNRFLTGSVVRDVQKNAKVPVLLASRPFMCEEPYSWKDAFAAVTVTTVIVLAMFLLGVIFQRGPIH
ncbi:MAG: universal stress protein [Nitrospirae bacterium]|nr:universal stress protein [Nitrospirota bacterium]